jgi:hypothetical protein
MSRLWEVLNKLLENTRRADKNASDSKLKEVAGLCVELHSLMTAGLVLTYEGDMMRRKKAQQACEGTFAALNAAKNAVDRLFEEAQVCLCIYVYVCVFMYVYIQCHQNCCG